MQTGMMGGNVGESENGKKVARLWAGKITRLYRAAEAFKMGASTVNVDGMVFTKPDDLIEYAESLPSRILVRSDWHEPWEKCVYPREYEVLLFLGGFATRLIGFLDADCRPKTVTVEWSEMGMPWTEWIPGRVENLSERKEHFTTNPQLLIDSDSNATMATSCSRCGESLVGAENSDPTGLCNACLAAMDAENVSRALLWFVRLLDYWGNTTPHIAKQTSDHSTHKKKAGRRKKGAL